VRWHRLFFGFGGRIDRTTLWTVFGSILLAWIAVAVVDMTLLSGWASIAVPYIAFVMIAYCYLMAAAKRFHDRNRSGWWVLAVYAPPALVIAGIDRLGWSPTTPWAAIVLDVLLVPAIWAFVELFCLRGTVGPNDYGPDPLSALDLQAPRPQ